MKVLLLAGGESGEREVSLSSGVAVYESLKKQNHDLIAIDPSTGENLLTNDGIFLLQNTSSLTDTELSDLNLTVNPIARKIKEGSFEDVDVVFIALHGGSGENGSLQNLLDLAGMKYTGSGMAASAVAMDKAMTKKLMLSVDVATPEWELYQDSSENSLTEIKKQVSEKFSPPYIVKPNDGGSTLGLTKVTAGTELLDALKQSAKESPDILVEKYIEGRELTVSVFDGKAYPVVEICPQSGLYDYEAKYTKGRSEYKAPADLEAELAENIKRAAVRVYETVNASGLTRVDFILDSDGNYFCLEINTLPGMTALSLAPMAMECEGIDFDMLIDMMIKSALK